MRGQALNLSSEISCVGTNDLKALYHGSGLDKCSLNTGSLC